MTFSPLKIPLGKVLVQEGFLALWESGAQKYSIGANHHSPGPCPKATAEVRHAPCSLLDSGLSLGPKILVGDHLLILASIQHQNAHVQCYMLRSRGA